MTHDQPGLLSRRSLLRAALGGASAFTVASLAAACAPAAAPGQNAPAGQQAPAASNTNNNAAQLKIGLLSGFSGQYAAFGPDMANSIDVYLDQHNGMVGGMKPT